MYVCVYTSIPCTIATGTNEEVIIKVIVAHNNSQRQDIKTAYKTIFGRVRWL